MDGLIVMGLLTRQDVQSHLVVGDCSYAALTTASNLQESAMAFSTVSMAEMKQKCLASQHLIVLMVLSATTGNVPISAQCATELKTAPREKMRRIVSQGALPFNVLMAHVYHYQAFAMVMLIALQQKTKSTAQRIVLGSHVPMVRV